MDLSDESLIARVARGDRSALEILYDRHSARVLGLALQIIGERATAEELLQETFWQVWQSAATFPSQPQSIASWLFRIVRNLSSSVNTHVGHQEIVEMAGESLVLDPALNGTQVRNALKKLPREQRQVIEMAYFHGMTRQEIANSTGESQETISGLARSGLQKMQQALHRKDKID